MEWYAKVRNDLSDLSIIDSNGKGWTQNELGVVPIVSFTDDGKVTVLKHGEGLTIETVTFDSIDLDFQNYLGDR